MVWGHSGSASLLELRMVKRLIYLSVSGDSAQLLTEPSVLFDQKDHLTLYRSVAPSNHTLHQAAHPCVFAFHVASSILALLVDLPHSATHPIETMLPAPGSLALRHSKRTGRAASRWIGHRVGREERQGS